MSELSGGVQTPNEITPDALFIRYQNGAFDEVAAALAGVQDWPAFVDDVSKRLPQWPADSGAAFALEAAHALFRRSDGDFRRAGSRYHRLLELGLDRIQRPEVPRNGAVAWHRVRFALHHAFGPEMANISNRDLEFSRAALRHFPDEPVIQYLSAVSREQELHEWLPTIGVQVRQVIEIRNPRDRHRALARATAFALMDELADEYERLEGTGGLGGEPALRAGVMRLLNDERPATEALPNLQRAVNAPDPWVAYLAHLFIGRVWLTESRADFATEAFQKAAALRPTAQSARIGLATSFVLDGRNADASRESDRLLAETSALDDPWYWFAYGAYRRLPEWLHLLREAIS